MLRDNQPRAKTARLVFLLYVLTTGAVALLSLLAMSRPDWERGASDTASSFTLGLYYTYNLLLVGQFVLNIAGYVVLILWLRRAYYNLHQLPGIHPDYSDGWAAGAWFVPFLNFVRPFTIMREVWNDTQRAALGKIVEPATILGWWWAAYLLKVVVGRVTSKLGSGSDSAGIMAADLSPFFFDAVAGLLAGVLTWYAIGRVATFEQQLTIRQQINLLGQAQPPQQAAQSEQADYQLEEGY